MNDHKDDSAKHSRSESENTEHEHLQKAGSIEWTKFFRIFLFRIPLWLITAVAIVIGGWSGYSKLTEVQPVNLRPAISEAKKVEIVITTCNDKIDAAGFDIRKEETRLEKKFKDVENVVDTSVLIQRDEKNCPNENLDSSK